MKVLATIPKELTVEDLFNQQEKLGRKGLWNLTMQYPMEAIFVVREVPISKLYPYGYAPGGDPSKHFTRTNKLSATDNRVIDKLKKRIETNQEVYPVIVAGNYEVLDGWHRLVAYRELGVDKVRVYVPKKGTLTRKQMMDA